MVVHPEGEKAHGDRGKKERKRAKREEGTKGKLYTERLSIEKSSSVGSSIDVHPGYAHGPEEWQGHNGWGPHLDESEVNESSRMIGRYAAASDK